MGWLLELLIDGIREICSQFIVDMMELVTGMFTELLSCDLTLFEELFSVVGDLYSAVIMPMGIAILLLILVWQLFKSMFGKVGVSSEDPIELVFRSCISLFAIVAAKPIVNYILKVAGTPYQWVAGTKIEVKSFSGYVSALEGATAPLGIGSLSIAILMLIMQFVVAWNYFKMLFIIAERYVLLGVFSYTSPLAFSTGGSKATNNILASWAKMFGGQVVLIVLNAWCMKMFLSGYGNLMASGYGFSKFFAATLCLVGFCKITFKMDSYLASLGVNLGRPSYGLGAMGMMMAINRLLPRTGSGGFKSEGGTSGRHTESGAGQDVTGATKTGTMAASSTGPIPMSFDMSGETTDYSNVQQESGFDDETGMQKNVEPQESGGMQEPKGSNTLEEVGVMAAENVGMQEDRQADMEMDTISGINVESGMDEPGMEPAIDTSISAGMTEGGIDESGIEADMDASISPGMAERKTADEGTGSFTGGTGIQESGAIESVGIMNGAGGTVGTGINSVNGLKDYPVNEKSDNDSGPEMELETGQIAGTKMDADGEIYGNEEMSLHGESHSGEKSIQSTDMGAIGEIGIEIGKRGRESYDGAGIVPDGSASMGNESVGTASVDNWLSDNGNIGEKEGGRMPGNMGLLNTGKTISAGPDIQNAEEESVKVPRSREEIRKR